MLEKQAQDQNQNNHKIKPQLLPGPKGHFLFGSLKERKKDTLQFFTNCFNQYGDRFRIKLGPYKVNVFANAEDIKFILQENPQVFIRDLVFNKLKGLLGNGLIVNDGETWRQQRKLMQPAFHHQSIQNFFSIMVRNTDEILVNWQKQKDLKQNTDVSNDLMKLTLRIVSQSLFGFDTKFKEDQISEHVSKILPKILTFLETFLPRFELWPIPSNIEYWKMVKNLDKVILTIIENRRKNPTQNAENGSGKDLLNMLLFAVDEETKQGMTNKQLRDEVMTMFMAGHETTANALAWTLFYLSQNPQIEKKLIEEVQQVLGVGEIKMEHLKQLIYTKMVFEESLRLRPPIWSIPRTATVTTEINGALINKGETVTSNIYLTHQNPKYWDNPQEFNPERFSEENKKKIPKFAYIPFGAGPHVCIGNQFAMMEALVILAKIYQKFKLRPAFKTDEIKMEATITLRPKPNLQMRIE